MWVLWTWLFWRRRTFVDWNRLNWTKRNYKTNRNWTTQRWRHWQFYYWKPKQNRSQWQNNFICSGITNLLFAGLAYITIGHFILYIIYIIYITIGHILRSDILLIARIFLVLYAKPSNKVYIWLTLKFSFVHYEDWWKKLLNAFAHSFFSGLQKWHHSKRGRIQKLFRDFASMAVRLNLRITSEHRGLLSIDIYIYTTQLAKYPRAAIKSHYALQLFQLSIHSKTVHIFIQVLVMNSVPLIYYFLIQEWLRNNFPSENLDDLSAEILADL